MWATAGVTLTLLAGCVGSVPADPDGTLNQVRDGLLRVGVSPNPPWTELHDDNEPSGIDAELVRQFASTLDADIEWAEGGEEALITDVEHGELDLVIGGFTAETPWVDKVAVTKPFTEVTDEYGEQEEHVMVVRMGENAFLLELETFLLNRKDLP